MKKIYKFISLILSVVFISEALLCNTAFASDDLKEDVINIIEDIIVSKASVDSVEKSDTVALFSETQYDLKDYSEKYSKLSGIEKTNLLKEYGVRTDTMDICEKRGYNISQSISIAILMQRLNLDIDSALEMADFYGNIDLALEEAYKLVEESYNNVFFLM